MFCILQETALASQWSTSKLKRFIVWNEHLHNHLPIKHGWRKEGFSITVFIAFIFFIHVLYSVVQKHSWCPPVFFRILQLAEVLSSILLFYWEELSDVTTGQGIVHMPRTEFTSYFQLHILISKKQEFPILKFCINYLLHKPPACWLVAYDV